MPLQPLIAVVDDDRATCHSLERLLRCHGFDSCGYTSAAAFQASDRLLDTTCLILDVRMPGKSGLELQAELRADGHRFPIIFITGYLDEQTRERALKAGAVGVLEKPFEEDLLIATLKGALKTSPSVVS